VKEEIQAAFEEMIDISTDIDKAVMMDKDGVLASNMDEKAQGDAVAKARELVRLAEERATQMGSQPFTQLVVDSASGYVFLAKDAGAEGATLMATGKKGSRVGLVLYDLKTCLRDAFGGTQAEAPKSRKKKGDS